MKKLFTFILGMGAMLCANAQAPYAYDLSYDAANYNVHSNLQVTHLQPI